MYFLFIVTCFNPVYSSGFSIMCYLLFNTSQDLEKETPSFEALLQGLMNLGVCLYPTAPESRIGELRAEIAQIQERCSSVKDSIRHRHISFYILWHKTYTSFFTLKLEDAAFAGWLNMFACLC